MEIKLKLFLNLLLFLFQCSFVEKYQTIQKLKEIDSKESNNPLLIEKIELLDKKYEIINHKNDFSIFGFSCETYKRGINLDNPRFLGCFINKDIEFHVFMRNDKNKCKFFGYDIVNLNECFNLYEEGFYITLNDMSPFDEDESFVRKFDLYSKTRIFIMEEFEVVKLYSNEKYIYIIQRYENKKYRKYLRVIALENEWDYLFIFPDINLEEIEQVIKKFRFVDIKNKLPPKDPK